ncbi:uncharacterized protein I206_101144 [Kwoniella pini CBS 10737]|uniref:Uncharacterized protein n=1 Tax=Kwoniella pini CBS 10737 TaxID=1296096 RepID=A0A1B9IBT5_9TREE|nr:uncharacterized protein I206_00182 [Kwoniella pini CBS 10737]OCF52881.1 hypothetical protein I206_00182 [Kwoniella pini CBS 10737]
MPIDVTPTPIHPHSLPPVNYHSGWSPGFTSGPTRLINILPRTNNNHIPGSILPNGLRNPWSHYSGETYIPSSESISNLNLNLQNASAASNGSIITERGGGGGRSIISPTYIGSNVNGGGCGGGYREDEGWNGSLGRNHLKHLPDFSNLGSIGPTHSNAGGGWISSSYENHRSMTPTIISGLQNNEMIHSPYGQNHAYIQPDQRNRIRRSRKNSKGVEGCEECMSSRGRKVSFSSVEPSPLRQVYEVRTR